MPARIATTKDIPEIVKLQEANLFGNLSVEQRLQGFVTTPFTVSQLERLVQKSGLFVMTDEDGVCGYTMAAGWDYFSEWPIFPHMIQRLIGTKFIGVPIAITNSFQYGPICIASKRRGSDALPRLFDRMREQMSIRFPIGITFVNQVNTRSVIAHTRKLKMTVLDEFEFSGRAYLSLAFDTGVSVL